MESRYIRKGGRTYFLINSNTDDAVLGKKILEDERKEYHDAVHHPSYYTDGKIEVIEYIEDKKLEYHLGNAVKYISRAGKKDPNKEIEDLQKAVWYINRRIKLLEAEK